MKLSIAYLLSFGAIFANAAPILINTTDSNLEGRNKAAKCSNLTTLDRTLHQYGGNAAKFWAAVPKSKWLHSDCIFETHLPLMGSQPLSESIKLKPAVAFAHQQTGVDPRIIMAIIMQESHGQLNVGTTTAPGDGSHSNGVMQADGCPSAAYRSGVVDQADVNAMVLCGTHHFQGNLADSRAHGDEFIAARLYNSGYVNLNDLNDGGVATGHYVNQIANRLRGWAN